MQFSKSVASPTGTSGITQSCVACFKINPAESLDTACYVYWVRPVCFDDCNLAAVMFALYIAQLASAVMRAHANWMLSLQTLLCFCVSAITVTTALTADMTQPFWRILASARIALCRLHTDYKRCILDRLDRRYTFPRIH